MTFRSVAVALVTVALLGAASPFVARAAVRSTPDSTGRLNVYVPDRTIRQGDSWTLVVEVRNDARRPMRVGNRVTLERRPLAEQAANKESHDGDEAAEFAPGRAAELVVRCASPAGDRKTFVRNLEADDGKPLRVAAGAVTLVRVPVPAELLVPGESVLTVELRQDDDVIASSDPHKLTCVSDTPVASTTDQKQAEGPTTRPTRFFASLNDALEVIPAGVLPLSPDSWTDPKVDVANEALRRDVWGQRIAFRLRIIDMQRVEWPRPGNKGYAMKGDTTEQSPLFHPDPWVMFDQANIATLAHLNLNQDVTVTGKVVSMHFRVPDANTRRAILSIELSDAALVDGAARLNHPAREALGSTDGDIAR